MTEQPSSGGYPPPSVAGARATAAYAPWLTRLLAWLIDIVPMVILMAVGYGMLLGTSETECLVDVSEYDVAEFCSAGASPLGQASFAITWVLALAYFLWNYGYRQGATGSTLGKRVLKFKVVNENSGRPIGFMMSLVRVLAHAVDAAICYIGFLFPLWDAKRQTLADKIIKTICVPL